MKFQCDRCKTRYSIADERVRGKVLKIRCKNCAGVITVRESGASSDAASSGSAPPAASASGSAPPIGSASAPARQRASAPLGAAFDRAMAQADDEADERTSHAPPPVHEDEWYLSSGANQDGPFDLKEAKRRVATTKAADDLFGWKEGFADWLPVAQIPELSPPRRPPVPSPPPIPPPSASRGAAAKPASLAASASARPAVPAAATARAVSPAASSSAKSAPIAKSGALGLAALAAEASTLPAPVSGGRAVPAPVSTAADGTNPTISLAELAKNSAGLGTAAPGIASNGNGKAAAAASAVAAPVPAGAEDDDDGGGLDFKISEASQLIDMSKLREVLDAKPGGGLAAAAAAARRTAANASVGKGSGPADAVAGSAPPVLVARPVKRPRAALLIGGGVAVTALVVGGLVFSTMLGGSDGDVSQRGGETRNVLGDYYGDRGPNVITRTTGPILPSGPVTKNPRPGVGRPGVPGVPGVAGPIPGQPGGKVDNFAGTDALVELSPQDVLDKMAQARPAVKQCFNYALKTDPTLRISRLDVRLSVAPDGAVNEVKYLSGAEKSQTLNQCLITLLKRWRFKPSREGLTTDIPIMFSSG